MRRHFCVKGEEEEEGVVPGDQARPCVKSSFTIHGLWSRIRHMALPCMTVFYAGIVIVECDCSLSAGMRPPPVNSPLGQPVYLLPGKQCHCVCVCVCVCECV